MGAGESSEKSKSNNNLSRSQVNSIIEEQRREFQRKYEELLKTKVGVDEAFLAEQTRIEARKEVDRLIKVNEEKMAQLMKEKEKMAKATLAAAQAPSPRAQAPAPPNPLVDTDRQRTPYSFSKNDLQIGVAQNSVTSIYPNLNERNGNRIGNTTPSTSCNNMNADIFPQLAKPNRNDGNFSYHGVSNTPNIPANYVNRAANIGNSNIEANRAPVPTAPPASRDRSASRTRKQKNPNSRDKEDELNCPTCKQKFTLTIYQCSSGHSSCNDCKSRRNPCGICGRPISDMRNRTLEQYISEIKVCCPNENDGCRLFIKRGQLESHEKECMFRDMNCALANIFGQCKWRGKLDQMASHFDDVHSWHRQSGVGTEMSLINICSENHVVYFVTIGKFNFLFQLKISELDCMVYIAVQLIGTNISAEKWTYEIHVYNKNKPRIKYMYTDICQTDNNNLNDIIAQGKCAMLPFSFAKNYINDNRFSYKFFIKRDNDMNPDVQGGARPRRRYGKNI